MQHAVRYCLPLFRLHVNFCLVIISVFPGSGAVFCYCSVSPLLFALSAVTVDGGEAVSFSALCLFVSFLFPPFLGGGRPSPHSARRAFPVPPLSVGARRLQSEPLGTSWPPRAEAGCPGARPGAAEAGGDLPVTAHGEAERAAGRAAASSVRAEGRRPPRRVGLAAAPDGLRGTGRCALASRCPGRG